MKKVVTEEMDRFKLAQQAGQIGTYEWDLENNKIIWTQELEKIYGLKKGGFKGDYENAYKFTHPEDREWVHNSVRDAIKAQKDIDIEYRVIWPDKSIHWLQAKGKTFCDETGKPVRMIGVVTDITQRKKMEILQEQYKAIVESSDDAIISKNLDGLITSWNGGAQRLYGYTPEEVIGQPVSMLMPPDKKDDFEKIMKELKAGRKVEHYETRRMKKNGEIIDVSMTVSPIRDRNGKIIGASKIARDISERKKLERQKDDFISIATHELKTPVTSVTAYAQVLQKIFLEKKDLKSAEYLGKMDAQLNKLTNLISDLLDVNKIQSGQLKFQKDSFDIKLLVEEVVEELQRTTDKHHLVASLGKSLKMEGDRDRIGQVLTNLISNAIKYSPHSKKIEIHMESDKKMVTICVKDYGIGIPKEKQDKVFEKFYRVSGPNRQTFPGLGLGLYISSEIIRRQSGKIWVESTKGKGSTFCISLPIHFQENKKLNEKK